MLRSKVIAYIDIRDISWVSPIEKNAVSELKSQNRHIKFSTSQNLSEFNGQKLGVVEYKMDFSPLLKTIVKYYLIISFLTGILYAVALFYVKRQSSCVIMGGGVDFCQSDFASKISLFACLYLFFFTLNFIFPTQSDDIDGVFGGLSAAINSYIGWNGRIGELLRVAFGASFAHTPFYAFINAFIAVVLLYLFFVLIFARLPLTQNKGKFSKFNDIGVICFMLICLFAFSGFGSVFYWAAGSFNYLWAWTLILAWCVPYRLFWGAVFNGTNSANSPNTNQKSPNSYAFFMLLLSLFAGWASEFGIVLFILQLGFVLLAFYRHIKLPLWCYAGMLGFLAGWLILYFSPGHAARASLDVFKGSYISISELLAMPLVESFKRFIGTFEDTMPHLLVAILGVLVFLWLKFSSHSNKAIIAILALSFIALYSTPNLRFAFVFLGALLCLVAGILLRKESASGYLFVLSGLFLAYFLATAATIQIPIPSRAKLPYILFATAQIIIAWLLLKPYLANFAKVVKLSVCVVCALYALFVLSASIDMRLKWERMLASIDAQKAMGREFVVVRADTFRSFYKGYGEWSNPNTDTNDILNIMYASVFGVKKFIVVESIKNVKFD